MNATIINEILKYIIPSALMLAGTIFTVKQESKKQQDLIDYRLNILEKKQDKYNNLQGRMYEAEKNIRLNAEKISVANHRLDDLEDKAS